MEFKEQLRERIVKLKQETAKSYSSRKTERAVSAVSSLLHGNAEQILALLDAVDSTLKTWRKEGDMIEAIGNLRDAYYPLGGDGDVS